MVHRRLSLAIAWAVLALWSAPAWAYEELGRLGNTAINESDSGVPIECYRQDVLSTTTSADIRYAHIKCNSTGALYVDTELGPAAQITADAQTAPTAGGVYAYMMCINGAGPTWNRCANAPQDVDDNSVAFSQNGVLSIGINHFSNGTSWIRLFGTTANGPTFDQANTAEADYDTGAGTVLQTMMGIALPASGGPVIGGTTSNPVVVSFPSSQNVTCSNCSGTGVSALEDAASANADPGTPAYAIRSDTLAITTSASGDYTPLKTTDVGRLWTSAVLDTALPAGTNVIGGVQGDLAHAAVDANNPLKMGVKATNALTGITTVNNAARTHLYGGLDGVLITRPHTNLENRVSGVINLTTTTSTAVIAAQGAGVRFCATSIVISNSSATNVTVNVLDGTAGAVLATFPASSNMGGAVLSLPVPLCTTANTAFAAQTSGAASTVSVTAVGFKTIL